MIPVPSNEAERLAALRSYEVLDTACEAAFDNITLLASELLGMPMALVSLIDADRQWFKSRVGLAVLETPREQAFCAHAILKPEETLLVPDATLDPRFMNNPLVTGAPDIRFYAGAPLVTPGGVALGTLCVLDTKPHAMTAEEGRTLRRLAEMVMTTFELRRALIEVRQVATIDPVTGVFNRLALIDFLDRVLTLQREQPGSDFALLYLDLDGFKQVNDRYGHSIGDAVLREVAKVLTSSLRHDDIVARLGGDEFAVIIPGNEQSASAVSKRVCVEVERCMALRGWNVTVSIGAAMFAAPPNSVDEALAAADALVYEAKRAGKNQTAVRVFDGVRPRGAAAEAAQPAEPVAPAVDA